MEQAHACKSSINSILQQPNLAVLSFNVNFHTHFPTPWVCTLCSGCLLPHVCTLTLHLPQGSDTPCTEFSLILHPKVSLPLHTTSPRVLAHFTFLYLLVSFSREETWPWLDSGIGCTCRRCSIHVCGVKVQTSATVSKFPKRGMER